MIIRCCDICRVEVKNNTYVDLNNKDFCSKTCVERYIKNKTSSVKCPRCSGEGKIDHDPAGYGNYEKCDHCNGKGRLTIVDN